MNETSSQMIDRDPVAAWCVTPPSLPENATNAIAVGAILARMLGPDGVSIEPAVELALPAAVIDPDGVVRIDSRTAHELGRLLQRAAVSAQQGSAG